MKREVYMKFHDWMSKIDEHRNEFAHVVSRQVEIEAVNSPVNFAKLNLIMWAVLHHDVNGQGQPTQKKTPKSKGKFA